MTSFQQKAKYMTWSSKIKPAVSTNAVFSTSIKENLQFITGLLRQVPSIVASQPEQKNARTCNTCETGHKVHIVSNHMWSKHRLTTGCSLNQGKKVQELNSAWLQVMSKHMQTKLVVATTVQDKLAYLALKQSHTCTGTTFASSSVKSLFQNYAQGTKQLMLLSVLP